MCSEDENAHAFVRKQSVRRPAERTTTAEVPEARHRLGVNLNHLAWDLCVLGRPEEALAHAEEAVAIYRAVVAQGDDRWRSVTLWASLDTLATALALTSRFDEALPYARESLEVRGTVSRWDGSKSDAASATSLERAHRLLVLIEAREPSGYLDD